MSSVLKRRCKRTLNIKHADSTIWNNLFLHAFCKVSHSWIGHSAFPTVEEE